MRQTVPEELGPWVPVPAAASVLLLLAAVAEEEKEKGLGERVGTVGRAVLLCIQESPCAHLEMLEQTLVKAGFYGN